MSDWKQIQARIRRAKAGADAAAQLETLFAKTRDAMVAFELAKHLESVGRSEEAVRWYGTAAQSFRRAEWKKKAEDAAARLSGAAPAVAESVRLVDEPNFASDRSVQGEATTPELPLHESVLSMPALEGSRQDRLAAAGGEPSERKRRHRGRRGGRNRRRPAEGARTQTQTPSPRAQREPEREAPAAAPELPERVFSPETEEATGPGLRGRSGDPGLSSRLAQLEMQLRRLLACPPVKLDAADRAPAGPGVFLVTDSDLITYYYVEPCRTLRIGISNLLRSSAGRKGEESLKARFADHLGITESRVAKYVGDHCIIRWLQLDENAAGFAHFAIAVLRPVLND